MWLVFFAASTFGDVTSPSVFQQRSAWVKDATLVMRLRDDNDIRTLRNDDLLSLSTLRWNTPGARPGYAAIGGAIFATLSLLIAHGPPALRHIGIGPASLSDGGMGGGWGLRF